MTAAAPRVRQFPPPDGPGPIQLGDRRIHLTPAVEKSEGGPLSAYSAFFGRGERADLPAPYEEIWVVLAGRIAVESARPLVATAGDFLHVPRHTPGAVVAMEDTRLVCISVPAH